MRQRPVRPDAGAPRITSKAGDGIVRDGQEMDLGMAVTVYPTPRRPPCADPAAPSLADPDVTEH